MRRIREAKPKDIIDIMQVMEAAKKIMRQSGNMHQWGEGYPSEDVIISDMDRHGGFVIEEDGGRIVGYFAFLPSPEPTYSKIFEGEWTQPSISCGASYCQHSRCSWNLQRHHGFLLFA